MICRSGIHIIDSNSHITILSLMPIQYGTSTASSCSQSTPLVKADYYTQKGCKSSSDVGEEPNVYAVAVDDANETTARNNHHSNDSSNELDSIAEALSVVETVDRRSLRLYSKKHRVYVFREFILQTYSDYLSSTGSSCGRHDGDVILLDVAGGKGDLSWILHNIDNYHSIVIDPRRTINHIDKSVEYLRRFPDECIKRSIPHQPSYQPIAALMPILEQKEYHIESPSHIRIFVDTELVHAIQAVINNTGTPTCYTHWDEYWTKAIQRTVHFITPSGKNDFSIERVDTSENNVHDSRQALQYILNAKLIVGYHPDQATDACFLLAQLLHVPVCVVPCCVFPSEFPHRRLYDKDDDIIDESVDSQGKPVEKYDDLIQYLLQTYPQVRMDALEFPGTTTARRLVLYTLPEDCSLV